MPRKISDLWSIIKIVWMFVPFFNILFKRQHVPHTQFFLLDEPVPTCYIIRQCGTFLIWWWLVVTKGCVSFEVNLGKIAKQGNGKKILSISSICLLFNIYFSTKTWQLSRLKWLLSKNFKIQNSIHKKVYDKIKRELLQINGIDEDEKHFVSGVCQFAVVIVT